MVNTFKVEPGNAPKLLKLLEAATEGVMKHLPGFTSANLHVSLDGTKVVSYAQWRDEDTPGKQSSTLGPLAHMEVAAKLAKSFAPVLYQPKSHTADAKACGAWKSPLRRSFPEGCFSTDLGTSVPPQVRST